ncbi:hypothetical protein, conserved [Eimeria maxima]|uniref:PPPDE domain-containing protein n=1 Tax=Eimeria maxima TaxID=5804 RepID=U6M1F5_EIMMA|nr:hypothetical protein, conserved [Eimeria maxima]CDJ56923.1 hypothetical protein, conserved [Eimeria maxima]
MQEPGVAVSLRVFDLSEGKAALFAPLFLRDCKKGIWHTNVCVYSKEYFYQSTICVCPRGSGWPGEKLLTDEISMGRTLMKEEDLEAFLHLQRRSFTPDSYDVFSHNCNHFSQSVLRFLGVKPLPAYIATLPDRVLGTVLGQIAKPIVEASVNLRRTAAEAELQGEVFYYGGAVPCVSNWRTADSINNLKRAARRQQQILRQERSSSNRSAAAAAAAAGVVDVFLDKNISRKAKRSSSNSSSNSSSSSSSSKSSRSASSSSNSVETHAVGDNFTAAAADLSAAAAEAAAAAAAAAEDTLGLRLATCLTDAWRGRNEVVAAAAEGACAAAAAVAAAAAAATAAGAAGQEASNTQQTNAVSFPSPLERTAAAAGGPVAAGGSSSTNSGNSSSTNSGNSSSSSNSNSSSSKPRSYPSFYAPRRRVPDVYAKHRMSLQQQMLQQQLQQQQQQMLQQQLQQQQQQMLLKRGQLMPSRERAAQATPAAAPAAAAATAAAAAAAAARSSWGRPDAWRAAPTSPPRTLRSSRTASSCISSSSNSSNSSSSSSSSSRNPNAWQSTAALDAFLDK